jgi:YidC/Oxa1 family membrane protein insertase
MLGWDQGVEILRESIFAYAQACNGNLGAGILIVTFLARLALLPLGVRLARGAQAHQRAMAKLQPELDRIKTIYRTSPRRVAEETRRALAREGVSAVPLAGCLGSLAQLPILLALYSGVRKAAAAGGRFLWISNLSQPDLLIASIAAMFTFLAALTGATGGQQNQRTMMLVSTAVTVIALTKMSAAVALYWAMSSLFGAVQGLLVRGDRRPATV